MERTYPESSLSSQRRLMPLPSAHSLPEEEVEQGGMEANEEGAVVVVEQGEGAEVHQNGLGAWWRQNKEELLKHGSSILLNFIAILILVFINRNLEAVLECMSGTSSTPLHAPPPSSFSTNCSSRSYWFPGGDALIADVCLRQGHPFISLTLNGLPLRSHSHTDATDFVEWLRRCTEVERAHKLCPLSFSRHCPLFSFFRSESDYVCLPPVQSDEEELLLTINGFTLFPLPPSLVPYLANSLAALSHV